MVTTFKLYSIVIWLRIFHVFFIPTITCLRARSCVWSNNISCHQHHSLILFVAINPRNSHNQRILAMPLNWCMKRLPSSSMILIHLSQFQVCKIHEFMRNVLILFLYRIDESFDWRRKIVICRSMGSNNKSICIHKSHCFTRSFGTLDYFNVAIDAATSSWDHLSN